MNEELRMEKKVWSRDWNNVDWDEICEQLKNRHRINGKIKGSRRVKDFTANDFLEYMNWLFETDKEEYWKAMLAIQLHEMGADMEVIKYSCENPDKVALALKLVKEDISIEEVPERT